MIDLIMDLNSIFTSNGTKEKKYASLKMTKRDDIDERKRRNLKENFSLNSCEFCLARTLLGETGSFS